MELILPVDMDMWKSAAAEDAGKYMQKNASSEDMGKEVKER